MLRRAALAWALTAAFAVPTKAADLCPPPEPLPHEGQDDFRMGEGSFTKKRYESAIEYLNTDLPKILHDTDSRAKQLRGSAFWITYRNNVTFLRGYVLRLRAESETASDARRQAVAEFCEFVSKAHWVD